MTMERSTGDDGDIYLSGYIERINSIVAGILQIAQVRVVG